MTTTISGLTAERMLGIEAASVVDGLVDANGDLILSKQSGESFNAGHVLGPAGASAPTSYPDALDVMATSFDYGKDLTFAIASDSTSNDPGDWPTVWLYKMAAKYPNLKVVRRPWNDSTQSYDADVIIQAGTKSPDLGGVIVNDTFSRTVADVMGSTPDQGPVWLGYGAGTYRADGTFLIGDASKIGALGVDCKQKNGTVTAVLQIQALATAYSQQQRFYLGSEAVGLNQSHFFVYLAISTSGAVSIGVYKRIGGAVTFTSSFTPADMTAMGITSATSTLQNVTLKLDINIQNVTVTATGPNGVSKTITHTMSESDYAAIGNYGGIANALANPSPNIKVDSFKIDTPFKAGTAQTLLGVISAMGGGTIDYQQSRLATMYPAVTPIDVMIISHGHNYSNMLPDAFTAKVKSFIDAYGGTHPESTFLISSQNKEQSPFSFREYHKDRNAALRKWARANKLAYLPAWEEFSKQADGGVSWVLSDGVHPTTTVAGTITGNYGSILWADVLKREVENRQFVK